MNPTHIHLLLNHVAILGALFSIAIFIYGLIRNSLDIREVSFVGFVVSAFAAVPVYLSGEDAEEVVEEIAGISHKVIHEHEEAAEWSIWFIVAAGLLALGALLLKRRVSFFSGLPFLGIFFIVSALAGSSITYTGYLGGKIRHPEAHNTTPVIENQTPDNGNSPESGSQDDD